MPAPTIADELRQLAVSYGADTGAIRSEHDPLEVLRWAGHSDGRLLVAVEDALIKAETAAVIVAEPTSGSHELMRAIHRRGTPTGIASNNSGEAITAYLTAHNLTPYIDAIAGRQPYAPRNMKPNADCLRRCVSQLSARADHCVYIGDSLTDIEAAHALDMPVIAFASTSPAKPSGSRCPERTRS